MVMALALSYREGTLILIAGYENGLAIVAQLLIDGSWEITYRATTHTQPVLSLDVAPSKDFFYTSSADAVITKHPIPLLAQKVPPAAASPFPTSEGKSAPLSSSSRSLLSAALASQPQSQPHQIGSSTVTDLETQPLKVINTKHSGQQDLKIRSDSKIFATAGWDSKIRVYSVKTMKEVAVLKWHQVGCYAIAFSTIEDGEVSAEGKPAAEQQEEMSSSASGSLVPRLVDMTVRQKRIRHVKTAHWLAAGSKDGKVSLWDVY
jgi:WD40 repeat protein